MGFYFAPAAMTAEKYNECIKQLKKAGAGHPTGRSYHAAFGPKDKLMVFDVWTSQAAFDRFGKTLMPIMAGLGVDPGKPSVMEMHSVVVPPRKAGSAKAGNAKAAKSGTKAKNRKAKRR